MAFFGQKNQPATDQGRPVGQIGSSSSFAGYSTQAPARSVSDVYANLTRQTWADIVRNVYPYQDKLISAALDPNAAGLAANQAGQEVNSAFDRQNAATDDRLRSLGLNLNPDEQKVSGRLNNLNRGLADVQARNEAFSQTRQRQLALLGSPAPNVGYGPNTAGLN